MKIDSLTIHRFFRQLKSSFTKMVAVVGLCLAVIAPLQAAQWNSTNIQILRGNGFELGADSRTIFTLENALGWKYGDSFFFIDVTDPFDAKDSSLYAEFSPRLSLGAITGKDMSFGIVKDIMISSTLESGEGVRGFLLGFALPLDLPGFKFADINFYARSSDRSFVNDQTDTGAQITLVWNRPFTIGSAQLTFDGFFDYAFSEGGGSVPIEDNIITAPRLMFGLGEQLQVGLEYQIWRNKFGIDGVDEDAVQGVVEFIF